MANKASQSRSEVDVLWDRLPQGFQLVDLPPDWDDDWIVIPIDSPESNLGNGPDEELFAGDGTFFEQNISIINTSESLPEELAGKFPGALNKNGTSVYPPADALAFYLPFHYFYPAWWGVYLLAEGVQTLARILYQLAPSRVTPSDCRTAARIFLFGHEQYHHSIESFATRLEITHRRPVYKTGFESVYQRTRDTVDWLEEALANANGFRRVKLSLEKGSAQENILAALLLYIQGSGPGYNRGTDYVSNWLSKPEEFFWLKPGTRVLRWALLTPIRTFGRLSPTRSILFANEVVMLSTSFIRIHHYRKELVLAAATHATVM